MSFPVSEYEARLARAQEAMAAEKLDALFLMSEPEILWFTGFRSLFWQSPTRPWFLVVPASGKPIAIVPEIGAALMRSTWIDDVRTWSSPHENDDGIGLLTDVLGGYSTIGMLMGRESSLRMPLVNFEQLREGLRSSTWKDATALIQHLRMVKSEAEIAVHAEICGIASRAFANAGQLFSVGQPLNEAFKAFKIELLKQGAEEVPYLVGGAGQMGYDDVISPPGATPLEAGDVMMLDTGSSLRGTFCDFDRNFALGHAEDAVKRVHEALWDATEAGLNTARPGVTCSELSAAMQMVTGGESDVGRSGHGLGLQLTEQPSIISWDQTVLEEGMVMTLEPSMAVPGGGMLVAEENIVIRDGAPQVLTTRASRELPII